MLSVSAVNCLSSILPGSPRRLVKRFGGDVALHPNIIVAYSYLVKLESVSTPSIAGFPAHHPGQRRNDVPSTHQPGGGIRAPAFAGMMCRLPINQGAASGLRLSPEGRIHRIGPIDAFHTVSWRWKAPSMAMAMAMASSSARNGPGVMGEIHWVSSDLTPGTNSRTIKPNILSICSWRLIWPT